MSNSPMCERWVWTELLAFDVEQPDYDVKSYLDTLGFAPDVISLLISAADMILQHESLEKDRVLPGDFCSRDGHDGNEVRRRQVWTAHQLRDLIARLRRAGVKVYLSGFVHYLNNQFHHEWLTDHPECKQVMTTLGRCDALNVLARTADGSYLEDSFARQLVRVCTDYGFDGWHGPDGYGPLNVPLHIVDCSDDMIGQFVESGQRDLPEVVTAPSNDEPARLKARMDWIWRHRRMEWIAFYVDRWTRFWRKIATSLHAIKRGAVVNSAWTRDPFEAIYRYGVDYRRLVDDAGVDGIVVETVAGGQTLLDNSRNYHYDYLAMLLLIKAHVPNTKLICLCNTKDVIEDWDLLRHGPATIEREMYALSNIYHMRADTGQLARCTDGYLACLGDGITREEWRWLDKQWQLGFHPMPRRTIGATLVWSGDALQASVAEYPATRRWNTHRIVHKLMECNAPIQSAVDISAIERIEGLLLVTNPHLLSERERVKLLQSKKPIVAIGADFNGWPKGTLELVDNIAHDAMRCRLYNASADIAFDPKPQEIKPLPEDRINIPDPPYFRGELVVTPVTRPFLKACAALIRQTGGNDFHLSDEAVPDVTIYVAEIGVMMVEQEPGVYRVALRNMDTIYGRPRLDIGRPIEKVKVRSSFPITTVRPKGSAFSVVVPPRGVVVCDVYTSDGKPA